MKFHESRIRAVQASPAHPLDRARLADVLRGCPMPGAEFIAEFCRSTDVDVDQLLAAAAVPELAQVARFAHRIEGVCRVVGAGALADACCAVAAICRSGDASGLGPALDTLLACRASLYAELLAPAPAAGESDGGSRAVCAGLCFLVVEVHDFQRSMILRLLRQLGAAEVHGFVDSAGALAAARGMKTPAIMVIDPEMPASSWLDVVRVAVREALPLSFLMNSTMGDELLRGPMHTARCCGGDVLGAVGKPLTAARLAPLLAAHRQAAPAN